MQLYVIFEKNTKTGDYRVAGVADNQNAADRLAGIAIAKGKGYSAYTDTYTFTGSLGRDCYVVYVKNDWTEDGANTNVTESAFGKMYYQGAKPSSADIKIYKLERSALDKMETIISDIGGDSYEHRDHLKGTYGHLRIDGSEY